MMGLDGSVTNGMGAYSFGFFSKKADPIFLYHGPVHGEKEQQNSTRSEMHGILGGVLFLTYISQKYNLTEKYPTITVVGDNLESLRIAREGPSKSLRNIFSSDMDVAYELRQAVLNSVFQFEFDHVKAHQDDHVDFDELTVDAKINVQCDQFVSKYFNDPIVECPLHQTMIPHYPSQRVSLRNYFSRITSAYRSNIHRYKVGHEAEKQCAKTWKIPQRSLSKVDWSNLRNEFRSRRGRSRFRLTKSIHRQWPTMVREKRWKRSTSSLCPLCKQTDENLSHVFQCQHDLIKTNRSKQLSDLKSSLQKYKTSPLLINHIMRMLYQYCGGHRVSKIKSTPTTTQFSLQQQLSHAIQIQVDILGVQNMILGIVTPEFMECQRMYLKTNSFGRNYNADRWGRWFVREMFEFSTQIWQYRCSLIHDKKEGSMEHRLRSLAVDWLLQLQQHQTLIPLQARHLINRSAKYFKTGPLRSVNAWIRRIEFELQKKKLPTNVPDIRKWLNPTNKTASTNASILLDQASDTVSTTSTITDYSTYSSLASISCKATRDLLMETDTIPTFPQYKRHECTRSRTLLQTPTSILVPITKYTGDRYEYIQYKKPTYQRILVDTDVDTNSELSSDSDFSVD